MSGQAYIVPTAFLETTRPQSPEWHSTAIESDPSQSIIVVRWDNPNSETEWESLPEVLALGDPWEPMPVEAAALLAPTDLAARTGTSELISEPVAPETVGAVLRKMEWHGARLLR